MAQHAEIGTGFQQQCDCNPAHKYWGKDICQIRPSCISHTGDREDTFKKNVGSDDIKPVNTDDVDGLEDQLEKMAMQMILRAD